MVLRARQTKYDCLWTDPGVKQRWMMNQLMLFAPQGGMMHAPIVVVLQLLLEPFEHSQGKSFQVRQSQMSAIRELIA